MSTNPQVPLIPSASGGGGAKRLALRYGPWILLVTLIVTGFAFGAAQMITPKYVSTASVVVEPRVFANTTPLQPDMGTEKQVAQSGVVLEAAAEKLDVGMGELDEGLAITVTPDANVLVFTYTHADAGKAQRRAEAVAEGYVKYRNADAAAQENTAKPTLQATLVTRAGLPAKPIGSPVGLYVGVGLLAGLALGVGTSLIRDRLDDGLRGPSDVEKYSGMSLLASIPRIRPRRGEVDEDLPVVVREPDSAGAEAFRHLRTRLQAQAAHGRGATLLIASPEELDGRTTTATNLAISLAVSGAKVVLIDADLRYSPADPTGTEPARRGLTDVLGGRWAPHEALVETIIPGLRMLPAGRSVENGADLLEPSKLQRTLSALLENADFVIVDSGPLLETSDAAAFASVVDSAIIVVDLRHTTRAVLSKAVRVLRSFDAKPLGAVANFAAGGKRKRRSLRYESLSLLAPPPPATATTSSPSSTDGAAETSAAAHEPQFRQPVSAYDRPSESENAQN
ncbi:tyrosine-protein kinase domain-containing protein [Flindersiella endophytica]